MTKHKADPLVVDMLAEAAALINVLIDTLPEVRRAQPSSSPEWHALTDALRDAEDQTAIAWAAVTKAHVALTGRAPR